MNWRIFSAGGCLILRLSDQIAPQTTRPSGLSTFCSGHVCVLCGVEDTYQERRATGHKSDLLEYISLTLRLR